MTDKCFKMCVPKPGVSLGNSEQVPYNITFIRISKNMYYY